jgi:hypothetical protein
MTRNGKNLFNAVVKKYDEAGIDNLQVLDRAIEAARTFKPMTKEEIAALLGRTREAAAKG